MRLWPSPCRHGKLRPRIDVVDGGSLRHIGRGGTRQRRGLALLPAPGPSLRPRLEAMESRAIMAAGSSRPSSRGPRQGYGAARGRHERDVEITSNSTPPPPSARPPSNTATSVIISRSETHIHGWAELSRRGTVNKMNASSHRHVMKQRHISFEMELWGCLSHGPSP